MSPRDQLKCEPGVVIDNPDYRLECSVEGTRVTQKPSGLTFTHSFVTGAILARAKQSGQAILRACGNKKRSIKSVLDLTGGWGIDSFSLALHGRQVTMLEYNPVVFAIVEYAILCRARANLAFNGSLTAFHQSAGTYLDHLDASQNFDCIYLDPMFPAHRSGAKPGKEMQILQSLTGNLDIIPSFEKSLLRARQRVVVKRPLKAAALNHLKPDMSLREKTIRFDIYLTA